MVQPDKRVMSPRKHADLQQRMADLTQLSYLNDASILSTLSRRYQADSIYTNAGPVLIAVNPCKDVQEMYTAEIAQQYKTAAFEAAHQLPPHIYQVAGAAFRDMVRHNTSQSLVISGESGAGKTETTKKAMQFLAQLAGGSGVEDQVLETNPILEAFGNAKTLRNHNSSRFGKLIEIHFNESNHICGARIRTYLLEKSRVVHQLKGERSFHIFYQLVRGASNTSALKQLLRLPQEPSEFAYLSTSGCEDIDGVDDAEDFNVVLTALSDIGVQQEDILTLLKTLAGILWLGNLTIDVVAADDSSRVCADDGLSNAAELLGLTEQELACAITQKQIKMRDEVIIKKLSAQEASDARDALAKALYAGVFNWIVAAINAKLDMGKKGSGRFIAILDIYGFEQFQVNSFEQLCINYANERLQQQFTNHLLKVQQEEYEAEGIFWKKVDFASNQACIDLIDAVPPKGLGVLAVLNDQCSFSDSSDASFMDALRSKVSGHSSFSLRDCKPFEFGIKHYAGCVTYNTAGFLDKNKDRLSQDAVDLLKTSTSSFVGIIGLDLAAEAEGKRGCKTVSSRFTSQLKELVAMLDTTGLHFVRCIKPNAALTPGQLCRDLVLQQLRCCGVLEVVRVARAGYPTRYRLEDYMSRYSILLPPQQWDAVASKEQQVHARVAQLLAELKVAAGQFVMGKTKVFFKPGVLGFVEDSLAKRQRSATQIQAYVRMHLARQQFIRLRAAALLLQSRWRGHAARRQLQLQHEAARVIQRSYRCYAAQQQYQRVRSVVCTIQAAYRCIQLQKRVAAWCAERIAREQSVSKSPVCNAAQQQQDACWSVKDQAGPKQQLLGLQAPDRSATECGSLSCRDAEAAVQEGLVQSSRCEGDTQQPQSQQSQHVLLPPVQAYFGLGGHDQQQLQDMLSAAAVCQQLLGTCDPARVQEVLQKGLTSAPSSQHAAADASMHDSRALADTAREHLGHCCTPQQLQRCLEASSLCQQQLGGRSSSSIDSLKLVLQMGKSCCQAGLEQPSQLQAKLRLAAAAAAASSPDDVAAAVALQQIVRAAAGAAATPERVVAALALQQAAAMQGIHGVVSLQAALSAAAAGPAHAADASPPNKQLDDCYAGLGKIVAAAGLADPSELHLALKAYTKLRPAFEVLQHNPKLAREACSMYAAAVANGITTKQEFLAAAELYPVLRSNAVTSPVELEAAIASHQLLQRKGMSAPGKLASAIELAKTANAEGINSAQELLHLLTSSNAPLQRPPAAGSTPAGRSVSFQVPVAAVAAAATSTGSTEVVPAQDISAPRRRSQDSSCSSSSSICSSSAAPGTSSRSSGNSSNSSICSNISGGIAAPLVPATQPARPGMQQEGRKHVASPSLEPFKHSVLAPVLDIQVEPSVDLSQLTSQLSVSTEPGRVHGASVQQKADATVYVVYPPAKPHNPLKESQLPVQKGVTFTTVGASSGGRKKKTSVFDRVFG